MSVLRSAYSRRTSLLTLACTTCGRRTMPRPTQPGRIFLRPIKSLGTTAYAFLITCPETTGKSCALYPPAKKAQQVISAIRSWGKASKRLPPIRQRRVQPDGLGSRVKRGVSVALSMTAPASMYSAISKAIRARPASPRLLLPTKRCCPALLHLVSAATSYSVMSVLGNRVGYQASWAPELGKAAVLVSTSR